jgi:hypothetical protein
MSWYRALQSALRSGALAAIAPHENGKPSPLAGSVWQPNAEHLEHQKAVRPIARDKLQPEDCTMRLHEFMDHKPYTVAIDEADKGYGGHYLLAPTPVNVRESQNRSVEIRVQTPVQAIIAVPPPPPPLPYPLLPHPYGYWGWRGLGWYPRPWGF